MWRADAACSFAARAAHTEESIPPLSSTTARLFSKLDAIAGVIRLSSPDPTQTYGFAGLGGLERCLSASIPRVRVDQAGSWTCWSGCSHLCEMRARKVPRSRAERECCEQ